MTPSKTNPYSTTAEAVQNTFSTSISDDDKAYMSSTPEISSNDLTDQKGDNSGSSPNEEEPKSTKLASATLMTTIPMSLTFTTSETNHPEEFSNERASPSASLSDDANVYQPSTTESPDSVRTNDYDENESEESSKVHFSPGPSTSNEDISYESSSTGASNGVLPEDFHDDSGHEGKNIVEMVENGQQTTALSATRIASQLLEETLLSTARPSEDEGEKIFGPNSVSVIFYISSKNTFKSSASSRVDTGMDSFLEDFLIDTISMLFMRISVLMKNTTLVDISSF